MSDEAQFESWLGESLSQVRKGPCPDARTLANFLDGALAAEEKTRVENHVAACGYCDLILTRMGAFERALRRERRARWLWLVPALAATLVLAFVLRSERAVLPPAASPPPAIQFAQVLQLDATRGTAAPARLSGTGPVALAFFIPIVPGHHYEATIAGRATVWKGEVTNCDPQGNCFLICDRKSMPAGQYTLTVSETESLSRSFQFSFEL